MIHDILIIYIYIFSMNLCPRTFVLKFGYKIVLLNFTRKSRESGMQFRQIFVGDREHFTSQNLNIRFRGLELETVFLFFFFLKSLHTKKKKSRIFFLLRIILSTYGAILLDVNVDIEAWVVSLSIKYCSCPICFQFYKLHKY